MQRQKQDGHTPKFDILFPDGNQGGKREGWGKKLNGKEAIPSKAQNGDRFQRITWGKDCRDRGGRGDKRKKRKTDKGYDTWRPTKKKNTIPRSSSKVRPAEVRQGRRGGEKGKKETRHGGSPGKQRVTKLKLYRLGNSKEKTEKKWRIQQDERSVLQMELVANNLAAKVSVQNKPEEDRGEPERQC